MPFSEAQILQHQLFRIKHTELNEIFLVMSLRSFVCAMVSIFVPIYLFLLGYSLRDILLLNLIMFIVEFAFEYPSALIRTELGPKHAIALSLPPLLAHFWLLATIQTYHWPLWFPAVCGGIALALYWQGYHYDFSKSKHKGQATRDVSRMYIILAILGAIAPFVGSSIATYFGFNVLYLIVILALGFVFIPLLKQSEKHTAKKLRINRIKVGSILQDMISYGGSGIDASIAIVIWPLFVFAIVKNYQSVGLITSLALVLTIAVTYMVGKKVTNGNRHAYIKASSYLDGIVYTLLVFVETFIQVASLNIVRSLASALRSAPFVSEYYLHADEQSRSEYILFMEASIDFFRIIMFSTLIGLTYILPDRGVLAAGLFAGAIGAIMTSFMPKAKCELPVCELASIHMTPKLRPKNATN